MKIYNQKQPLLKVWQTSYCEKLCTLLQAANCTAKLIKLGRKKGRKVGREEERQGGREEGKPKTNV